MGNLHLSLPDNYWDTFQIKENDLDFIYNHLLEIETPQTPQELLRAVVGERIRIEKQNLESQQKAGGTIYLPKNQYKVGQTLQFPALGWEKGKVVKVRPAKNPELPPFEVIEINFESGSNRQFAANLETHVLNKPVAIAIDDPGLSIDYVLKHYGQALISKLSASLEEKTDLVRIAGRWFPRALLVDVNIGHLNLAEAILDVEKGGPLPTRAILEQIELPTDVNIKLTEFSLNLALEEDDRFDEVGPSGEILWFLHREEPAGVLQTPQYLRYQSTEYDRKSVLPLLKEMGPVVIDELEPEEQPGEDIEDVTLGLIYPHWRSGTLPLAASIKNLFPTAYEAPRVMFTFIDGDTGQKFSGWVVRASHYVYGLREWYVEQGMIPGSLLHIQRSKNPGEVIIRAEKRRTTREWIRTVLVGADGGIVFAMLKQMVAAAFDERLATVIPDVEALDHVWELSSRRKVSLEQTAMNMMRELAKLNPQGHVHAQELYSAVNIIRRCPPGQLLNILITHPWANHLGDLYFRIGESRQEELGYE
jgi:hypothetical protein